jgi:hypothetical protein
MRRRPNDRLRVYASGVCSDLVGKGAAAVEICRTRKITDYLRHLSREDFSFSCLTHQGRSPCALEFVAGVQAALSIN